jgi:hypothetical protein
MFLPNVLVDLNSPSGIASYGYILHLDEPEAMSNGKQYWVGDMFASLLSALGLFATSPAHSKAPTFFGVRGFGSHFDFICTDTMLVSLAQGVAAHRMASLFPERFLVSVGNKLQP